MSPKPSVAEKLCLTCGLCCNGVIFADVQLQKGDDPTKLEAIGLRISCVSKRKAAQGLPLKSEAAVPKRKFPQPCAAFDGCHCRIYADRPRYCREFDCALLKSVNAGEVKTTEALRTIEKARKRAEKVRQLLRQIGDKDEQVALSLRFRRTAKRMQQINLDQPTSHLFGELTLAVHDLNLLLSERFYS